MGVDTYDEEMSPGSTVPDGLEHTEKAREFEQQPENEKIPTQDADYDTRVRDEKTTDNADRTDVQPISPMYSMSRRPTSNTLKTDHNNVEEKHKKAGDTALPAISQRPQSDTVDDTSKNMRGVLVTPNTDTPSDKEESVPTPTPAQIMELLDKKKNMKYETLQEKITLADSDTIKQDLPINPDQDLVDEEGYTPLYKTSLKGHLGSVDDLISHGANPNETGKDGLAPLRAAAREGHLDIVDYLILQGAEVPAECEMDQTPLHTAAQKGHTNIMENLIRQGSDMNKVRHKGSTPFNTAVQCGKIEGVKCLIAKGAEQYKYDGMSPLYAAAELGHLDLVKFFIYEGADVKEENDDGRIPLHGAALRGHMQLMEYLIQQGSDVNKEDADGWTPFNAAVQCGKIDGVKFLIAKGAEQNKYDGMSPLYAAAELGHLDLVKFFVSEGADVQEEIDDGRIPLHGAAIGGHLQVMEYLIQQGSDVTKASHKGWTPFNAAVQYGKIEGVKYLIAKGAEQNKFDEMSPLYAAAEFGHLDLVKFFISEGADVQEETDDGSIPLHGAAVGGHMEVMEYLIQQGSDVNKKDHIGRTPFHDAVQNGHLEAVKLLMANTAQSTRIHGVTPLYIATQYDHIHVVKHLVSKGQHVNERSECGRSSLHAACYKGNIDVVKYLVYHDANFNEQDADSWTPLHAAAQEGHRDVVEFLAMNGADIKAEDNDGWTPLHAAAQERHLDVVEFLVLNGADITAKDTDGMTPLHAAAQEGHRDVVEFLAMNGADITCKDNDGWTPLHAAAQDGHRDVVEFLTLNGADITEKDIDGMTPLQAAKKGGHAKVVKYLTLCGDDTVNKDTSNSRYGIYQGDTHRHHTSSQCAAPLEDEDMYGSEGMKHRKSPEKRFAPEQASDAANTDSGGGYSLADADDKDITSIHSEYLPTMPSFVEKEEKDDFNPFVSARLKPLEKAASTAEQTQVNGSMPVERESSAGRDLPGNICPAQYDSLTLGFTNNTDHNVISLQNGSPKWKHDGFDPFCLRTTKTNCHRDEETDRRCHTVSKESFSSNAGNDQLTTEHEEKFERPNLTNPLAEDHRESNQYSPFSTDSTSSYSGGKTKKKSRTVDHPCSSFLLLPTTEHEEKFERPNLTNPLAEDHHESNQYSPFSTDRTSSHSGWKTKKKRQKVDNPCSSFLFLLHMITTMTIILAGSPVLVAGSIRNERVTLQEGTSSVIPFNLTWESASGSNVDPSYTLQFESKIHPFCINGHLDLEGFKSPSQFLRFNTSFERLATSLNLNLFIESVDTLDQDTYVLTVMHHDFQNLFHETFKKEVLVHIPPGPAECSITLSENTNYPYEVHCQATTGNIQTTLTCYQYGQRVEVEGGITDNGQVTRGVFLLPDQSPFSCCSHDVTSEVNVTMCNDFEWPPGNNHISPPAVNDPSPSLSVVNATAAIGNSEQASNTVSSVSLTIGLMIYLFLCC